MLDEAVQFINDFTGFEFEVRKAKWTEKDNTTFQAMLLRLNNYFEGDLQSDIKRPLPLDEKTYEEGLEYLPSVQRKKVFLVQQFEEGSLFAAYLSSFFTGGDSFFIRNYFMPDDSGFKIVSQYLICHTCEGGGVKNGRQCTDCGGEGWLWNGGARQNLQRKAEKTVKLQPPDNPQHLRMYASA